MQKSYLPGELIREIRKRKGYRQLNINNRNQGLSDSPVTISRIENLHQDPSMGTLSNLLSRVDLPYEQFFCPYMEDQPAESFVLRRQIAYLLDRAEGDEQIQALAREMIDELKGKLDFESIINKQLWISMSTKLDVIEGGAGKETLSLIMEGIRLTYPEFDENDFNSDVLIFNECDLLLNLARYHANVGSKDRPGSGDSGLDHSLKILKLLLAGYVKQPISEMYKEVLLGEIHNLIVRYLLEKGDYAAALDASEEAMSISKRQTGNSQLPNAVYLRALALFHAGGGENRKQGFALLRQAYFAFSLLKMDAAKKRVLKEAGDIFQMDFETYGTEGLVSELPHDFYSFKSGSVLAVENIGGLLRQFRIAAGIKQADVYKGVCSRSFYSRIEGGTRTGISFFVLEALMQRLGRDMGLYIDYFSSMDEWEESRLRMQYMRELSIGNANEAKETLASLMATGNFTQGLGKQFLLFSQAIMKWAQGDSDGYTDLLYEAIRNTIPDFDENKISTLRLTFNECNIINAIANHYAENGQVERGLAMYLQIKESMDKYYIDDSIKVRYYLTLLSNLTLEHYNTKQYEKALEFANESESICERHGALFLINGIARLKTMCLYELGRRDESAAYAAMAYFSGNLTAGEDDLNELDTFAKEKLGIAFPADTGFVFHREKAKTYTKI